MYSFFLHSYVCALIYTMCLEKPKDFMVIWNKMDSLRIQPVSYGKIASTLYD